MYAITGKVFDKVTGLAINEAVISIHSINGFSNDIAQLTNEQGIFKWSDLDKGNYEIKIIKEAYLQQSIFINVSEITNHNNNDEIIKEVTILLEKSL
ncbi:peptidase associated/transthyretin-like domain-containing protein [Aquimarina agarilytica]|uniref:carboxypeptidase regulatory-like domain-containing protein n=1 Tax=Aquimarina agarilytica TaxID=1087449 RepID=UPI000287D6A4|nr:carboxypeptidase regulatory-like domain-containing protein [Aquimarina agarilytica]